MSFDWPVLPLEECLDALIDYRGKTPEKTSSGIPLITAKVIKNGRIEKPSEFIAINDYDAWMRRGIPKVGDVVMTTEAPLGEVAQLSGEKIALAQRVITLRGKSGLLDSSYLLYLLQTAEMQEQLKSRATGTTVLGIKQSELRKVTIKIPPLALQKDAASILSVLDKKIDLLRETNTTLEAIAQTLFKSWFVDFDPVKAKAEGRLPEGMDEATAALFPSEFEESALGLIPKGWKVGLLSQVADVIMGQSPDGSTYNEDGVGMPLVNGPVEFGSFHPEKTKWTSAPTRLSKANDLIVCVRGSTTGKYVKSDGEYCMGRGVCAIRGLNKNQPFVDLLFHFNINRLLSLATGSTFPSWNGPVLKNYTIVIPPLNIQHEFSNILKPIFDATSLNAETSKNLTSIRDTLLPRLISGQLRINQAQEIMDEVGA